MRIQEVSDDIAEGLGLKETRGALVAGVTEKGPAAEAGIVAGDVILEFDGQAVNAMHELPRMVADEHIGKEVQVEILRKGKEQMLTVKLGRLEDAVASADSGTPPADNPTPPAVIPVRSASPSPTCRRQSGLNTASRTASAASSSPASPTAARRRRSGCRPAT